jgi:hypothetical protein
MTKHSLSTLHRPKAEAEAEIEADHINHADQAMGRSCLICHTQFLSSWTGERICKKCKSSSAWKQG